MQGKQLFSASKTVLLSTVLCISVEYPAKIHCCLSNPTKSVARSHINTMDLHILRCFSGTRDTETKGRNTILKCIRVR